MNLAVNYKIISLSHKGAEIFLFIFGSILFLFTVDSFCILKNCFSRNLVFFSLKQPQLTIENLFIIVVIFVFQTQFMLFAVNTR